VVRNTTQAYLNMVTFVSNIAILVVRRNVVKLGFEVYRYSKQSRYRTVFFGIIPKTVIGNRYMNTVF